MDEYIKCRPASQIERLIKRIKEGRIEVTGMYFNFDEIPDEKILPASEPTLFQAKIRNNEKSIYNAHRRPLMTRNLLAEAIQL
jgi:hypothetical protein